LESTGQAGWGILPQSLGFRSGCAHCYADCAYCHADPHANTDQDENTHHHTDVYTYSHANPDHHADPHSDQDYYSDSDFYTYSYSDIHPHSHSNQDSYTNDEPFPNTHSLTFWRASHIPHAGGWRISRLTTEVIIKSGIHRGLMNSG
jgi:hypothetical protein